MPIWIYDRKDLRQTPSFQDNIDNEKEATYRREAARFIVDLGSSMNLRFDTIATAVVYFHRFFMRHSFKDFNRNVVAVGCLFLAGKVEETPKKCKDLIAQTKLKLSEHHMSQFGEDPKEEIITMERVILQTIYFDLQIEHPYEYVLKYAKVLKGDKNKLQEVVQMAWTFVNDSLCTMLCLQYEPEVIAVALIYLAGRLSKFDVTDWANKKPQVAGQKPEQWWDQFVQDLQTSVLEDICHQVLDLYSSNQPKDKSRIPGTPGKQGQGSNTSSTIGSAGNVMVAGSSTNTQSSAASSNTSSLAPKSDATRIPLSIPTMPPNNTAKLSGMPSITSIIPTHNQQLQPSTPPVAAITPVSAPPAVPHPMAFAYPPPTMYPGAVFPPFNPAPPYPPFPPNASGNVVPTTYYPQQQFLQPPPPPVTQTSQQGCNYPSSKCKMS